MPAKTAKRSDVTDKADPRAADAVVVDANLSKYLVELADGVEAVLKNKKIKGLRSSDGLGVDKGGSQQIFDKAAYDKMVAGKSDEYTCSGSLGWFNELWQPIAGVPFNGPMVHEFKDTRFNKPSRIAFCFAPPRTKRSPIAVES